MRHFMVLYIFIYNTAHYKNQTTCATKETAGAYRYTNGAITEIDNMC